MIELQYTSNFMRELKKMNPDLIEEVIEKIEQFKDRANHKILKVHKLKGKLYGRYSFSVNYKMRIIFHFKTTNLATLITIGDHDIYK